MKVHLIKAQTIRDYVGKHKSGESSFENWITIIKVADWANTNDICATFATADLLGNGSERVVFNIAGNKYRMICSYQFGEKEVHLFVCWIGTHAEYDKLCKQGKQYTISEY